MELEGTYLDGSKNRGPTIQIIVEAPVPHGTTVTLTQDLTLSGTQSLNWTDTTVIGNGHLVRSAANWSGSVIVKNAQVSGLGSLTAAGIM